MKIILLQTVPKLGKEGQIVSVKDGYARNFLFPQKLALLADRSQIKALEKRNERLTAKLAETKAAAEPVQADPPAPVDDDDGLIDSHASGHPDVDRIDSAGIVETGEDVDALTGDRAEGVGSICGIRCIDEPSGEHAAFGPLRRHIGMDDVPVEHDDSGCTAIHSIEDGLHAPRSSAADRRFGLCPVGQIKLGDPAVSPDLLLGGWHGGLAEASSRRAAEIVEPRWRRRGRVRRSHGNSHYRHRRNSGTSGECPNDHLLRPRNGDQSVRRENRARNLPKGLLARFCSAANSARIAGPAALTMSSAASSNAAMS